MCLLASFCTHEIDSTPPATTTSFSPAMTRCAAITIVCSPLEQKRLTVMPLVVIGSPARKAIWRAMLLPVAPSGVAQPMIDVVALGCVDAGALDRGLDGMAAEGRAVG